MKTLKDEFFKQFPAAINLGYRCCVDGLGDFYCVWDIDKPEDCFIASEGIKKCDCEHWKENIQPAFYTPDEIWEWLSQQGDR